MIIEDSKIAKDVNVSVKGSCEKAGYRSKVNWDKP